MPDQIFVDICVVGGGSGGLYVAAGASQMGADVALIESGKMGGDCLNHGCVPSKALIAAAHTAHTIKSARRFGIEAAELNINFKASSEIFPFSLSLTFFINSNNSDDFILDKSNL